MIKKGKEQDEPIKEGSEFGPIELGSEFEPIEIGGDFEPIEIGGEFIIDAEIDRVRRYAKNLELQYTLLNKYRYKKAQIEKVGEGRYKVHTEAQGIVTDAQINLENRCDDTIIQDIVLNIKALGMKFENLPCTLQCTLKQDGKQTNVSAKMKITAKLDPMRRNLLKFGLEKKMQSEYNRLRFYLDNGDI